MTSTTQRTWIIVAVAVAAGGLLLGLAVAGVVVLAARGDHGETAGRVVGAKGSVDGSVVDGQPIETACWAYDGPRYFVDRVGDSGAPTCQGQLELGGSLRPDGTVVAEGVGEIYGSVQVEPIRVSTAEGYAPGTDVDAVVDALEEPYLSQAGGTITSLHESATLGGQPANITRIDSDAAITRTKVVIAAYAPAPYPVGEEEAQLFLVSIVTPYANGDELVQQVLDSWQWK